MREIHDSHWKRASSINGVPVEDVAQEGETWYAYGYPGQGSLSVLIDHPERPQVQFEIPLLLLVSNLWVEKVQDQLAEWRSESFADESAEESGYADYGTPNKPWPCTVCISAGCLDCGFTGEDRVLNGREPAPSQPIVKIKTSSGSVYLIDRDQKRVLRVGEDGWTQRATDEWKPYVDVQYAMGESLWIAWPPDTPLLPGSPPEAHPATETSPVVNISYENASKG